MLFLSNTMQHKFFRKESNQWENVNPELWQWEAHYIDGSVFKQFDDGGIFHQTREIDQSRLHVFKVVNQKTKQAYVFLWDRHKKLIFFYRHTIMNAGTPQEYRLKTYCFGYETKMFHKTHKVIMMITPSGEIVVTDNPDLIEIN